MFFALLATINGLFTVFSRMVNASLATAVGSLRGSFVNHLVGTVGAGFLLLVGLQIDMAQLATIPWIYFIGGCLGVLIVAASNYAVRHIGAALFAMLLLAGQLLTSAFIDHYSLLGNVRIPITPARIAGIILLLGGALLVITDRSART